MKPTGAVFSKYPDQHFVLPRIAVGKVMRIYDRYLGCNLSVSPDPLFMSRAMEVLITDAAKEVGSSDINIASPYYHTGWPGLWNADSPHRKGSFDKFFSVARPFGDAGDALHKHVATSQNMTPPPMVPCCNYSGALSIPMSSCTGRGPAQ